MRSRRWEPANNELDGLLFDRSVALIAQLDDLVIRPRRWWRETLLPIVYLVCAPAARNPLNGLAGRWRQSRGLRHSMIDGKQVAGSDDSSAMRRLLDEIVVDFSQRHESGRPLRFPHYSLAVWLMSLITATALQNQPDQSERRIDDALQDFIKNRYRLHGRSRDDEINLVGEIPWWIRLPILLLPPLGIRLMRALWRPPHWAAGLPITKKYGAGSFRGLARRFMEQGYAEQRHGIQPSEIDQLLVDAFMEDLRRAYRRTPLFLVGFRRATYPVLLVANAGVGTPGAYLLDLISESRTEFWDDKNAGPGRERGKRAYFHPLLIIAHSDSSDDRRFPPSWKEPDSHSTADIKYYYDEWHRSLTRTTPVWLLALRVPGERPPKGLRAELIEKPLPSAPRPVALSLTAGLLVAAAAFTGYSTYYTHCGAWFWQPALQRHALGIDRSQCVGLGSDGYRFFADVGAVNGVDPRLAADLNQVEATIHEANALALKDPNHLTVVYLSELSSQDVADYRSELERLRGVAVAQAGTQDRPVRVLLANGGDGMDYGREAADSIKEEAREDPSLVTVIGLGISRAGTRDAIIRLAEPDLPLPTIGTSISSTELATNTSPYYHQVGPTNRREAAVGAYYAKTHLGARRAVIYYSGDRQDLYSDDLRKEASDAFQAAGMDPESREYRIHPGDGGGEISLAGRSACEVGPNAVVFYAGRTEQLPIFLGGMKRRCEGDYPNVMVGDDVGRFVLDGSVDRFSGLTVHFLASASSLAWGPDCRGAMNVTAFFPDYERLFHEDGCVQTRSGGSLLAHDSLAVFVEAVRNKRIDRPSPDAVLSGIEAISTEGPGPMRGVSGEIDYPRTGVQAVPRNKAIVVLRAQFRTPPVRTLLCGLHLNAQPPPDQCPADR